MPDNPASASAATNTPHPAGFRREFLSYIYLAKWVFLAIVAGFSGSVLVRMFHMSAHAISCHLVLFERVPLPYWTLAGALCAGTIIYRLQPDASGEGIPSYIRSLRLFNGTMSFSVTAGKFFAALATIATFGNGGIVGPLGRVSAGIASLIGKGLARWTARFFTTDDIRTAAICGCSAAVGAIFHASIGGGIFAVEIIQRAKMGYRDLFPAILSSATAVFVCKTFHWESFYRIPAPNLFMQSEQIGWLLLVAICVGFAGGGYTALYIRITRLIRRQEGNTLIKVLAGSLCAATLCWLLNPRLLGTSNSLIDAVLSLDGTALRGNLPATAGLVGTLVIMACGKALGNCITVGSGMSAGFTGPAAITGMLLGAAIAAAAGMTPDDPTYFTMVAAGFSGMLASSMNIPLAAAVITTEIFGLQYSFAGGLAAIVGFQTTRHQTIYDYTLAGAGNTLGPKRRATEKEPVT